MSSYAHVWLALSQVSHHPPSAAHHVFSKHGWRLWQEITIASKFRGKYISIMPLGELGRKAPPQGSDAPIWKPAVAQGQLAWPTDLLAHTPPPPKLHR